VIEVRRSPKKSETMKFLVFLVIAVAATQSAPANDIQKVVVDSKIPGTAIDGLKTVGQDMKPVLNQYQADLQEAVKTFPAAELNKALKSSSDKINNYGDSLQNIMKDPRTSPEDKANQAISNLTPVLNSILADLTGPSSNIENYVKTYSDKATAYNSNAVQEATNKAAADTQKMVVQVAGQARPELDSALKTVQTNLNSQQSPLAAQIQPAVQAARGLLA